MLYYSRAGSQIFLYLENPAGRGFFLFMKEFILKYRVHVIILVVLLVIVLISGYLTFFKLSPFQLIQSDCTGQECIINFTTTTQEQKEVMNPTSTITKTNFVSKTITSTDKLVGVHEENNDIVPVILKILNQEYSIKIAEHSTVYDLMKKMADESKITFSGNEYASMGYFVDTINGIKNDVKADKYWIYYLNGQSAKIGISNYIIQDNDLITWKYEKAQF